MLPLVLYNYARVLDLSRHYEEGAALAKEGQESCLQYGHYQYLSGCLEIYAECCFFLGRTKESAKAYRQAYYLCEITGNDKNLEITRKEAKEYLGMEFESDNSSDVKAEL